MSETQPDEHVSAAEPDEFPADIDNRQSLTSFDDDDIDEFGRIGYGRYGKYSPAVLGLLIVVVVAIIGWRQWQPDEQATRPGKLVDQPAPDFSLELFNGEISTLTSLKGEAVVLNFWGSWCEPCKVEMPALQNVQERIIADKIPATVLGVGIKNDYGEAAAELIEDLGITYPAGRDTAGDDPTRGPIETAYGVASYPTTVVIRPDGTVFTVRIGPVTEEETLAYIEDALAD